MICTTYRSEKPLNPRHGAVKRYVRWDAHHGYVWCKKQERSRFDFEQGTCAADDIEPGIRAAADKQRGQCFSYVDWPEPAADGDCKRDHLQRLP